MKTIKIEIRITDNNIGNAYHFIGFNENNIQDALLILGALENLKALQQEKLKTLLNKTFK